MKVTTDEGRVCYSVEYDGQEVLKPSRLGLRTNVGDFTEGLTLKETKNERIEKQYDMTRTKTSHVNYNASQLTLRYETANGFPLMMTFNVSDNDVSYR